MIYSAMDVIGILEEIEANLISVLDADDSSSRRCASVVRQQALILHDMIEQLKEEENDI